MKKDLCKESRHKKHMPMTVFALIVLLVYLAIAIPLHFIWSAFTLHWFWFGFFFLFFPLAFLNLFAMLIAWKHPTAEEKKNAGINICKYIALFWLYDFLYMSIFNKWLVWEYIFGVLAIIIIFYNLTKSFLNEYNAVKWMLPFDLILGVGLSIYL